MKTVEIDLSQQSRDPRRALTRARICAAAKEVFFINGVMGSTAEEIAKAAGIQKSTFYTYFQNKDQILSEIADDYIEAMKEVIAKLPGPIPSQEEVDTWVQELLAFSLKERPPAEILMFLSFLPTVPEPVKRVGDELMKAYAMQVAAFKKALKPRQGMALARARAATRELGTAICFYVRHGDNEETRNELAVATELFSRFVRGDF